MNNQHGSIRPLLCILLLLISAYLAMKFVGPYYRYYALKSEATEIARLSYRHPEQYRKLIYEKASQLNVPIEYQDIEVVLERDAVSQTVSVYTEWTETVELPAGYKVRLHFEIDIQE